MQSSFATETTTRQSHSPNLFTAEDAETVEIKTDKGKNT
jgi:hypothetical protein